MTYDDGNLVDATLYTVGWCLYGCSCSCCMLLSGLSKTSSSGGDGDDDAAADDDDDDEGHEEEKKGWMAIANICGFRGNHTPMAMLLKMEDKNLSRQNQIGCIFPTRIFSGCNGGFPSSFSTLVSKKMSVESFSLYPNAPDPWPHVGRCTACEANIRCLLDIGLSALGFIYLT